MKKVSRDIDIEVKSNRTIAEGGGGGGNSGKRGLQELL